MQILEIQFGTPEFDDAVRLRYEVLRRPLGLEYTAEQLAAEHDNTHLAAYDTAGSLIGYLNLTPSDRGEVKMRQVAVHPACQGTGVGRALVEASEGVAKRLGFNKLVLHARETAVPFYQKLNYAVVGERFEEVSIPHFRMEKNLVARTASGVQVGESDFLLHEA
ncbi:MAG: GNAT family N-acetyltransferase [Saprospiraceae bacterium]